MKEIKTFFFHRQRKNITKNCHFITYANTTNKNHKNETDGNYPQEIPRE